MSFRSRDTLVDTPTGCSGRPFQQKGRMSSALRLVMQALPLASYAHSVLKIGCLGGIGGYHLARGRTAVLFRPATSSRTTWIGELGRAFALTESTLDATHGNPASLDWISVARQPCWSALLRFHPLRDGRADGLIAALPCFMDDLAQFTKVQLSNQVFDRAD